MAILKITAMPCDNGALYYRRAGHVFNVGQPVELDASTEVEAELRASRRLNVEAVLVTEITSDGDDNSNDNTGDEGDDPSPGRKVKKSRSTT